MTEAKLEDVVGNTDATSPTDEPNDQEVTEDPREVEARAQGWVPKEEWEGPEGKWRDLDEFLDVGERIKRTHKDLRAEIKAQEKANQDLKKAVETLIQGQEAIRKAEREKTIRELKDQRREAVAEGDVTKVEQLDDAIEKEKVAEPVKNQGPDPEVTRWMAENTWYGAHNPEAQAFANALDAKNAQAGIPVAESLKLVEVQIKKRFPELFNTPLTPAPRRASAVEAAGKSRPSKKATTLSELPSEVQEIAKAFESQGVMTVKKYIELYNKENTK